jgi:hypothetical protein
MARRTPTKPLGKRVKRQPPALAPLLGIAALVVLLGGGIYVATRPVQTGVVVAQATANQAPPASTLMADSFRSSHSLVPASV